MGTRIAVVGATGNVGREILAILDRRRFPADEVFAVASHRSVGKRVAFGERMLRCHDLEAFDFGHVDLVLMSAGSAVSEAWAPRVAKAGAIVIDNSSRWRMDPDVPLVVPEVNADAVLGYRKKRIIANPNCSTAQLVVALKPIHDAVGIRRVVVSTYQSVSGAGREAMDELENQSRGYLAGDEPAPGIFRKPIAFNLIPHIDVFMEDGSTKEEWKMRVETKKIVDPSIELVATCVRVPVFVGHSEAVHVETLAPMTADACRALLRESPGITLVDDPGDELYITPRECVGDWTTCISRVRRDPTIENGLAFWCVSDNLRKGAALNAVQIAEELLARGILRPAT